MQNKFKYEDNLKVLAHAGADPGFFLGGGALVSCSSLAHLNTNKPHSFFFFFAEY